METPTVTDLDIPYPADEELHLCIRVGGCRVTLRPGTAGPDMAGAWIRGTYHDPSGKLPPHIHRADGNVRITQGHHVADYLGLLKGLPRMELALANERPFRLSLDGGAGELHLDLGGLPITGLALRQGAGKSALDFSAPNPVTMHLLHLGAGAAAVEVRNAAHAHFTEMKVEGGAAAVRLDFGGALRQDAAVQVTTGMSAVELHVPATTAARIYSGPVLGQLDVGDGFMKQEGGFCTEGALAGRSPQLTIRAGITLGALHLRAV